MQQIKENERGNTMKKFMTLVLALVMVLAIAVPAMAFTSDISDPSDASPFELDIYLVEYDNDEFFGITSLPPSDRGYAKNEIVAAIVELYVPKGETLGTNYTTLEITGDDVDFKVTDNDPADLQQSGNGGFVDTYTVTSDEITLTISATAAAKATGNKTYKVLVFAKVTGEEASITASLVDKTGNSGEFDSSNELDVVLGGDAYVVKKNKADGAAGNYTVTGNGTSFKVFVDKNYKSTGLSIESPNTPSSYVPLGLTLSGALGVVDTDGVLRTSGDLYDDVMDVYDDTVKGVFGLDYMLIGNYVRDSFWTGLTSGDTLSATVEIKPWTAYVTVPDNIVVDPPKTGDAASIVGFVMIVLAAAAVVAVKKVRA